MKYIFIIVFLLRHNEYDMDYYWSESEDLIKLFSRLEDSRIVSRNTDLNSH